MGNIAINYLDCWILDEADDDGITIWELVSVLQQRQPGIAISEVLEQLRERLEYLLRQRLLNFYEGVRFRGEEQIVNVPLSYEFIEEQAEDWKYGTVEDKQYKIYLTPNGREIYLTQCRPEDFIFDLPPGPDL